LRTSRWQAANVRREMRPPHNAADRAVVQPVGLSNRPMAVPGLSEPLLQRRNSRHSRPQGAWLVDAFDEIDAIDHNLVARSLGKEKTHANGLPDVQSDRQSQTPFAVPPEDSHRLRRPRPRHARQAHPILKRTSKVRTCPDCSMDPCMCPRPQARSNMDLRATTHARARARRRASGARSHNLDVWVQRSFARAIPLTRRTFR
jgi:hypothetical protein